MYTHFILTFNSAICVKSQNKYQTLKSSSSSGEEDEESEEG